MPLDLFEALSRAVDKATEPGMTTEACGEEGNWCGGGPLGLSDLLAPPEI